MSLNQNRLVQDKMYQLVPVINGLVALMSGPSDGLAAKNCCILIGGKSGPNMHKLASQLGSAS